jgi:hypothetical protein
LLYPFVEVNAVRFVEEDGTDVHVELVVVVFFVGKYVEVVRKSGVLRRGSGCGWGLFCEYCYTELDYAIAFCGLFVY